MRITLAIVMGLVGCGDNLRDRVQLDAAASSDVASLDAPDAEPPARLSICVTNTDDTIEVFDSLQDGDVAPLRRFGNLTELDGPASVAVDTVHDEIYAANSFDTITVYGRTWTGGVAPIRSLHVSAYPQAIVVDVVHDELFVLSRVNYSVVEVYARTATGNATPLRSYEPSPIFGYGLALDSDRDELVIAGSSEVAVYPRASSGGAPLRTITGAATTLVSPTSIAIDAVHDELVVANYGGGSVAVFPRTATGNVAPLRSITGTSTGLGTGALGVAVDLVHDEIVASSGTSFAVFPRAADGDVAPTRTISAVASTTSLTIDTAHDELVAAGNGIATYARTASGPASPLRLIGDAAMHLNQVAGLAADPEHDEILVTNHLDFSITVFPHPTSTSASPSRVITNVQSPSPIAVDTAHDELVVADYVNGQPRFATALVFSRTASGDVSPMRTIAPAGSDLFSNTTGGVAIDTVHDELIVANLASAPSINVFARTADGPAAPLRTIAITGDGQNDDPYAVALDPIHDEIVVVCEASIRFYARTATGSAAPLRKIDVGPNVFAHGVAVDPVNDEVFVAYSGADSIAVFARTATGSVAPLRTITGPATWLHQPTSVALCR